jgi:hypothetical protein
MNQPLLMNAFSKFALVEVPIVNIKHVIGNY